MSESRPNEWAYDNGPKGGPQASFLHGRIFIFVGSGYRALSVADARILQHHLTAAIAAGEKAGAA